MAYVNVMLNNLAQSFVGDKPLVRIRVKNGHLQFLPTTRASDINLPPGERLRPVVRKDKRMFFSVMEDFLTPDAVVGVEYVSYGWYALVKTDGDPRTTPTAKLAPAVASSNKRSRKSAKPLDDANEHVSVP